uniref:Uncharacterized protein n=1 Tax=Setaria italica TaxID=4555 RepID=K3YBI7_SETIT
MLVASPFMKVILCGTSVSGEENHVGPLQRLVQVGNALLPSLYYLWRREPCCELCWMGWYSC